MRPRSGTTRFAGVGRRMLIATLLATTASLVNAALIDSQAHAQASAQTTFNIPAGELNRALAAFGRQSGTQVSYEAAIANGKTSRGFQGTATREQAIAQLLQGSGLVYSFSDATNVLITRPRSQNRASGNDGSLVLDTINVEGQEINNWDAPPSYAGGQVATGARLGVLGNVSIMDAPFSITSYTSKLIQEQQAVTVADVVANDPSVRVFTNGISSSAGAGEVFFIRGFSVTNQSILIDGYGGISPDRLIPVETMERVEVLKGPNALLTGYTQYGSLGGSINVVPKRATDEPVTRITQSYLSDSQFGTQIDFGRRFGPSKEWGVRVNGIFLDGDTSVDGQSARLGTGTLALDYRGADLRASLDAGYISQKTYAPTGAAGFGFASDIPIPRAPDASKQIYQNWEYSGTNTAYALGKFEYDINPAWTLYGGIGGSTYRQSMLSTDIFVLDSAGNATATAYYSPIQGNAASTQAGIRGEFATGPIGHKINLNTSYLYQNMNQESNYYGFYSFDTNIYSAPTVASPSTLGFSDNPPKYWNVNAPAVTLSDTLSFLGERILFTAGVRYQQIKVDVFNPDGSVAQAYDEQAVTPAFGLVLKPFDRMSLYANYIQGLQQGPIAYQGTANAGEVFPPMMTEQMEAGIKYDFGAFTATASIFQITKPSSIISTNAAGESIFSVNGEQRNRGVEVNVFGQLWQGLRLLGGVAYTQGTLTQTADGLYDGNSAVGVPNWQTNVGIEWDPEPFAGLTLWGRMIATSSQYVDQANTQQIPSWLRFDIGTQYKTQAFGNPLALRFAVENVFDKNYWAAVNDGWVSTGLPRTFKFSAVMDF